MTECLFCAGEGVVTALSEFGIQAPLCGVCAAKLQRLLATSPKRGVNTSDDQLESYSTAYDQFRKLACESLEGMTGLPENDKDVVQLVAALGSMAVAETMIRLIEIEKAKDVH